MSDLTFGQAMRLGAMALPEMRGPVFTHGAGGDICGACAVGAALFAVGSREGWSWKEDIVRLWPWAGHEVQHPVYRGAPTWPAVTAAVSLFENCLWSREAVAAWLDSIDPTIPREAPADPVPAAAEA